MTDPTGTSIPEIEEQSSFRVGGKSFDTYAEAEEYRERLWAERRADAYLNGRDMPEKSRGRKAERTRIVAFLLWEWRARRARGGAPGEQFRAKTAMDEPDRDGQPMGDWTEHAAE